MKIELSVLLLVLISSSAFASRKVACVDTASKPVFAFSFSVGRDSAVKLDGLDGAFGISPSLGSFSFQHVTDSLITPGAVEIRAKKLNGSVQGNVVISLRGDYDLNKMQGSVIYTEEVQGGSRPQSYIKDVTCK